MINRALARLLHHGVPRWAEVFGEEARLLPAAFRYGDVLTAYDGAPFVFPQAALLPPIEPGARVFCVGRNYRTHADELGGAPPTAPSLFQRIPESLVGSAAAIDHPGIGAHFDYEGEIAIVLKQSGWRLTAEQAGAAIGGITLMMDGSVRDYQAHSLLAGKNFRRSGALGPWIVPVRSPQALLALALETRLNGDRVQHGGLGELIHPPIALILYLSSVLELRAGDIISTGTPGGVGMAHTPPRWLVPGDQIEVHCDAIGSLRNLIREVVFEND